MVSGIQLPRHTLRSAMPDAPPVRSALSACRATVHDHGHLQVGIQSEVSSFTARQVSKPECIRNARTGLPPLGFLCHGGWLQSSVEDTMHRVTLPFGTRPCADGLRKAVQLLLEQSFHLRKLFLVLSLSGQVLADITRQHGLASLETQCEVKQKAALSTVAPSACVRHVARQQSWQLEPQPFKASVAGIEE